ncbi:hypothetical protein [uncultured Reyranella sp.]|uniref:hypothetical protein n=1 Tax=uncultured Reyranella sp. TaxID=735512 RepID=UPI0025D9523B|nr:hypothetical protein [uncultured Reyranella sp.]
MFERMLQALARHTHRPVRILPVVACVPGTDVWFLRYAFAFLSHLQQGGHVVDRLSGRCIGNFAGPSFNFDHMSGGPLLWVPDLAPSRHLFIGHTVCPGFDRLSSKFDWWASTPFAAPGYDYLHDGTNYGHVPVDLAPHAFVPVSVGDVDAAAWTHAGQRMVLVYGDPIEQAVGCFAHSQNGIRRAYNRPGRRAPVELPFHEYVFQHALPSYAKLIISYQAMAEAVPGAVHIVAEDALRAEPARILSSVLSHLRLDRWQTAMIDAVVDLSRREHIIAVEREIGRSLTGSRASRRTATWSVPESVVTAARDPNLRREALALLASMGVDTAYFQAPAVSAPFQARAAAAGGA